MRLAEFGKSRKNKDNSQEDTSKIQNNISLLAAIFSRFLITEYSRFMWMLVNGALLSNRGALFPALKASGFSDAAVRRVWAAFRGGGWQIAELLRLWQAHIKGLPQWRYRQQGGYRV